MADSIQATETEESAPDIVPNTHTNTLSSLKDDSEWEYEYSTNETENIYVTLDLTTHVPRQQIQSQAQTSQKQRRRRKRKRPMAEQNEDTPQDQQSTPISAHISAAPIGEDAASQLRHFRGVMNLDSPTPQPRQSRDDEDDEQEDQDDEDHELKFHRLTSENPIIEYQGKIYSCYWADTLGTDLLYYKPQPSQLPGGARGPVPSASNGEQASAEGEMVTTSPAPSTQAPTQGQDQNQVEDGVENQQQPQSSPQHAHSPHPNPQDPQPQSQGTASNPMLSTIRLLGKPATLHLKPNPPPTPVSAPSTSDHKDKPTGETEAVRAAKRREFLRRFAEVKARKGERDVVPLDKSD